MSDTMYDSTRPNLIPANALFIAVYVNGDFAADVEEVKASYPKARIYLIDVKGNDPGASIKDVETGDIDTTNIVDAVQARFDAHPDALCRVYCNLSNWPETKANLKHNISSALQSQIRWWIANPTNTPHFVPGSNATQYKWGTDFDTSIIGDAFK